MARKQVHNLRVLIADDEFLVRQEVKESLEELGHQVVAEATDGYEARNLARTENPNIAVLDIKMPQADGLEVAEGLIREGICAAVVLSAFATDEFISKAAEVGVHGFLTKPFDKRDLNAALQLAMVKFHELRRLHQEVGRLEEQLATRKLLERAKGILMRKHSLTEEMAYRLVQRHSMETRKSIREIAEAVIIADSLQTN